MIFEQFQLLALNVAAAYRLGMEAQASDGLVALIDALQPAIQAACGIDAAQINPLLGAMFVAQSRRDFPYLADLLQYELTPMLSAFPDHVSRGNEVSV